MHIPVLLKEVVEYLDIKSNKNYIDCTFGFGGHAKAILEANAPHGKVLGIEWDKELLSRARSFERLILINDSYRNLKQIVFVNNFTQVHGILFDLGMSTWHVKESHKGFSFQHDEQLDMRYSTNSKFKIQNSKLQSKIQNEPTAEEILNQWSRQEIEKILREYGEERFARPIAEKIAEERKSKPIGTTLHLVKIIRQATPRWYHRQKIHFATRTFQALRIAVNHELENIEAALPQALEIIEKGGRIAVISFHSLEDRIIKRTFQNWKREQKGIIITKKPVVPQAAEVRANPASRSAKLRVFEKFIKT